MTRLRPFGCAYDSYGRITQKASRNIHYHDAARPHWPSEVHAGTTTTPVAHDLNGNRTRARGGNPDYTYDAWDRLKSVAVSTGSVEFVYDYSGRRVAKLVHSFLGTGVTFYYSELAELSGNQLFKSYYLGGLRVASQRKSCTGCELAALTPTEAVRLAAVSLKSPALVVLLRRDVELALAAALVLFGTGVLLAPWKRRRVVGITLRHGQVIVVAVFFLSGTFPWPILLRPAEAQCGNPPTPTPGPTPTATPVSVGEVRHYHVDHLGSVQVVTDAAGAMVEQIRYQPYGEVRGRFDGLGNPITNPSAAYRYEFTGYESEILSGLQYAGARFYDPTLGLFLTQDPARQFASPYTYTGWDPMNLTDPSGAFVGGLIAGILAVAKIIANYAVPIAITVGFGTGLGQTLANGGCFGQAFAAGGGVIGGVGAWGLGIAGGYVASKNRVRLRMSSIVVRLGIAGGYVASKNPMLSYALAAVAIAGSTYQTVESFRSGQYVAGAVGAVFVAFAVASVLAASAQGGNGGIDKTSTGFEPGDTTLDEFDLRSGDVLGTDEGTYARVISSLDPTGDIGHTQITLQNRDGNLRILTSDGRGRIIVGPGDQAVSGRGYTVYRPRVQPSIRSLEAYAQSVSSPTRGFFGGLSNYLGSAGGQVCSSTCNTALLSGGIATGFAPNSFVTPNQLVRSDALLRVGRLPIIP